MPVLDLCETTAEWRAHDRADNPAGPLFFGGEQAVADIVGVGAEARSACSACSASCLQSQVVIYCC
jgi:hypothetical protein